MKKLYLFFVSAALCAPAMAAEPAVTLSKVRGFGQTSDVTALARGSAFLLEGTGFGGAELEGEAVAPAPYPHELEGVTVWLTSEDGAASVQAWVKSVSAKRVVAILPSGTAEGAYKVEVHSDGAKTAGLKVTVVERNVGIVTKGMLPGAAAVAWQEVDGMRRPNGLVRPARLGQKVILQATGLGPIEGPDNGVAPPEQEEEGEEEEGEEPGAARGAKRTSEGEEEAEQGPPSLIDLESAAVVIDGKEYRIEFAGRDAEMPGFDQIVFTLPVEDLRVSCLVPVKIRIGEEFMSLGATLSVIEAAPAEEESEEPAVKEEGEEGEEEEAEELMACAHPLKLTLQDLKRLDEGGEVVVGAFSLTSMDTRSVAMGITVNTKVEVASGHFGAYDAAALALDMARPDNTWVVNLDGCRVYTVLDDPLNPVLVDAGQSLALKTPAGDVQMKREEVGSYLHTYPVQAPGVPGIPGLPGGIPGLPGGIPGLPGTGGGSTATPASAIKEGKYVLSGTGGAVVGEFSAELEVSKPVTWTNYDAITQVNRGSDLTFTWTPGPEQDYVSATGVSRGVDPDEGGGGKVVSRGFVCLAPANRGSIVVPASILRRMPVSNADPTINETYGSVGVTHVGNEENGRFTAPLVGGGETIRSQISFSLGRTKGINYR